MLTDWPSNSQEEEDRGSDKEEEEKKEKGLEREEREEEEEEPSVEEDETEVEDEDTEGNEEEEREEKEEEDEEEEEEREEDEEEEEEEEEEEKYDESIVSSETMRDLDSSCACECVSVCGSDRSDTSSVEKALLYASTKHAKSTWSYMFYLFIWEWVDVFASVCMCDVCLCQYL